MSLYVVAIALLLFFSSAILSVLRSIFNAIVTFFSANADEFASFLSSPKVLSFLTFLVIALYIAAIIFFVCFIIVKKRHASEEEAEWFRQAYEAEIARYDEELAREAFERIQQEAFERQRAHSARIRHMSGWEYEQYVAAVLQKRGYRDIKVTAKSNDYGADIIGVTPYGKRIAIQCKKYIGHPIGVKAVQEIASAKLYYHCSLAMVVGISGFTENAKRMASEIDVMLETID